jgi:hypothetical protein
MRELTVETDALYAFTGITRAFQPQFQGGLVWGLPVGNLDAALLWQPVRLSAGRGKAFMQQLSTLTQSDCPSRVGHGSFRAVGLSIKQNAKTK